MESKSRRSILGDGVFMTEHPEVDAIFARAYAYYRERYIQDGYPPERFMVTQEEYHWLMGFNDPNGPTRHRANGREELRLFGMRVIEPKHMVWHGRHGPMEHIRFGDMPPLRVEDALGPITPSALEICCTVLPPRRVNDITCPCGEVIWHLRPVIAARAEQQSRIPQPAVRAVDSEQSTFDEWAAEVDALVAEVKARES
jgi:hypothetical protein